MLDFKDVRIPWAGVNYPPYHQGLYIEEHFYDYYIRNKAKFDATGYTLLPIFWTTAYLLQQDLTSYINALPKALKYFCVAQHDDGVKEVLPEGTIVFSAGGNSGGIPLPLVCSPIPEDIIIPVKKDIFCSFVGSITHDIRKEMVAKLKSNPLFYIKTDEWSIHVNNDKQESFINTILRSKFTLCPRGYGAQSFRFYEALQLGSIPIYIHDDNKWQPYSDLLAWDKFSVSLHIKDIEALPELLQSISEETIEEMVLEGRRVYADIFKMLHIPKYILSTLRKYYV